jgi:hypothetical protein
MFFMAAAGAWLQQTLLFLVEVPTWFQTQLRLASTNNAVRPVALGTFCSKHASPMVPW